MSPWQRHIDTDIEQPSLTELYLFHIVNFTCLLFPPENLITLKQSQCRTLRRVITKDLPSINVIYTGLS